MRFWPFGKEKEPRGIEFVSRVVSSSAMDGAVLRAKVSVSFREPVSEREAEEIADDAATGLRAVFASEEQGAALVGREADIARSTATKMRPRDNVRAVDVVAFHIVTEAPSAAAAGPSSIPPASSISTGSTSNRPSPTSNHPAAPNPRRSSSSQLLAVRDSRLIPEGANAEAAAYAIVPLLRDASTRVLVGVLRAFDLVIVRGVRLDASSPDDLGDLVPLSTAAPGHFADERRDELTRWGDKLGREKLDCLRTEASAIVCYFLHTSLHHAGVDAKTSTALLEASAHSAFAEEGPLSELPRYLGHAGDPIDALTSKVLAIVGEDPNIIGSLTVMLTPVVASLQEDFAFTSGQIKIVGVRA